MISQTANIVSNKLEQKTSLDNKVIHTCPDEHPIQQTNKAPEG